MAIESAGIAYAGSGSLNSTPTEDSELHAVLQRFGLGTPTDIRRSAPISTRRSTTCDVRLRRPSGVERDYTLTILPKNTAPERLIVPMVDRAAAAGLPVARFLPDQTGEVAPLLGDRAVLLSEQQPGGHPLRTDADQCASMGRVLAHLHVATRGLQSPVAHHEPTSLLELDQRLAASLAWSDQNLLRDATRAVRAITDRADAGALPRGPIHGALVRENVLYANGHLTAVLNFFDVRVDCLIADLAESLVDWCRAPDGSFQHRLADAMIGGYHSVRPLGVQELWFLPSYLLNAAINRWLHTLRSEHHARLHSGPSASKRVSRDQQNRNLVQLWWSQPPALSTPLRRSA